jgi:hypothetical protein
MIVLAGMNVSGSEDRSAIPSREIMEKIEKGEPVSYKNIVILGDLVPEKANLGYPYNISSPIEIENSKIYGNVNFDNAKMLSIVNFEKTKIFGSTSFNRTQFIDDAHFENTIFDGDASFIGTICEGSAFFKGAIFNSSAEFWNARFEGEFAEFTRSQFLKNADFNSVRLDVESASFHESKFSDAAIFRDMRIFGSSDFSGTQFEGLTDFAFVEFYKSSDFMGSRFHKEVILNEIKFVSLIITWDSLRNKAICNGPIYMDLIKNFKELEQFDDADACYYDYREWKRNARSPGWPKLFDYFAWLSCGYGVRLLNPIFSGFLTIILFGIYYESFSLTREIPLHFINKDSRKSCKYEFKQNFRRSLSFSAMTLLSLPSEWSPYGKEEYTKFVKHHLYGTILERMIGWGLMLLLIGILSRLMVRY